MNTPLKHLNKVKKLTDIDQLKSFFGNFSSHSIENIDTGGYSGARFSRLKLSYPKGQEKYLILKELNLKDDWFSHRTSDNDGREALVLVDNKTSHIHSIFSSPYHIVATEPGKIGLLMDDVSSGLFPDERKSIGLKDQNLILDKLAEMHAYYWESAGLKSISWLHNIEDFIYLMGPLDHEVQAGGSARNVHNSIRQGWMAVMERLPEEIKNKLLSNPKDIVSPWRDLPMTLIHGDTKVANFSRCSDSGLCLLDWAFVGYAPCTFELGWFLSVNAPRLAQTKEQVLSNYRNKLERHLGYSLNDSLWSKLEEAGIICGAFMLLWSKGSAVENNREGAETEWKWWIEKLTNWARK